MPLALIPALALLSPAASVAGGPPADRAGGPHCRTVYVDADGDGFGDAATGFTHCGAADRPGTVDDGTDCDDTDPLVSPDADEVCDGVDNDCDGAVDADALDAAPWYADTDGDGFGDPVEEVLACEAPADHVADATDCDDGDPLVFPGAEEVCDGVDNDCDGSSDAPGTVSFVDAATGHVTDLTGTRTAGLETDGDLRFCTGDGAATFTGSYYVTGGASVDVGPADAGPVVIADDGRGYGAFSVEDGSDLVLRDVELEGYTSNLVVTCYDSTLVADGLVIRDSAVAYETVAASSCYLSLTDGALVDNTAGRAVLYTRDSTVDLTGVDISDNAADLGALYVTDATVTLDGVAMDANTATGSFSGGHLSITNSAVYLTGGTELRAGSGPRGAIRLYSYLGLTAALSCRDAAILDSPDGGVYIHDATSTLAASACDFGDGADENALFDVRAWGTDHDFVGPTTVSCAWPDGCE